MIRLFFYSLFSSALILTGLSLANAKTTYSGGNVPYTYYRVLQAEIKQQSFSVINTSDSWIEFINSIPSSGIEFPVYDEQNETAIVLTTTSNPCEYIPDILTVIHQIWYEPSPDIENIIVKLYFKDSDISNSEICDGKPYFVNIVFIEKTLLPISFDISNP